MGKKTTLILTLLSILAISTANAQIGVTRDGQLKKANWFSHEERPALFCDIKSDDDHFVNYPTYEYDDEGNMPKYADGMQSVVMVIYECEYDNFNEKWSREDKEYAETYELFFDDNANMTESYFWRNNTPEFVEHVKYEYDGKKIKAVYHFYGSWDDGDSICIMRFFYDNQGSLSKVKTKDGDEWHITWNQQGNLSKIVYFRDGSKEITRTYQITKNGTDILYLSNQKKGYKRLLMDKHGVRTQETVYRTNGTIYTSHFFENAFDDKGNLTRQQYYYMDDIGKHYMYGIEIEYEYTY